MVLSYDLKCEIFLNDNPAHPQTTPNSNFGNFGPIWIKLGRKVKIATLGCLGIFCPILSQKRYLRLELRLDTHIFQSCTELT